MSKVTSEIYKETNFQPVKSSVDGKVVSKFQFLFPDEVEEVSSPCVDKDGDFIVQRKQKHGEIEIEHSEATEIRFVGLQVWRGALLLADFLFHCRQELRGKQILELGAGVGLTSIAAAAINVQDVICTDVDIGGILNLIRANVERNRHLFSGEGKIRVMEYDFMQSVTEYSVTLKQAIDESDVIFAADVIYDDSLTDAFIGVIECIFEREAASGRRKTIYVALEKRYVFALPECDAVAPMFEYFLKQTMRKPWRFEYIPINFPQYFEYERCRELVLLKLNRS